MKSPAFRLVFSIHSKRTPRQRIGKARLRKPKLALRRDSAVNAAWVATDSGGLRPAFHPCFALRGQSMFLGTGQGLDELDTAEADRRPVRIDSDHSDRFETFLAEELPTIIAVDVAFVLL